MQNNSPIYNVWMFHIYFLFCNQFSGSIDDGEKGDVPGISFSEFLTQCQELSDWLSHAQHGTERSTNSLSEKHLNSV